MPQSQLMFTVDQEHVEYPTPYLLHRSDAVLYDVLSPLNTQMLMGEPLALQH